MYNTQYKRQQPLHAILIILLKKKTIILLIEFSFVIRLGRKVSFALKASYCYVELIATTASQYCVYKSTNFETSLPVIMSGLKFYQQMS